MNFVPELEVRAKIKTIILHQDLCKDLNLGKGFHPLPPVQEHLHPLLLREKVYHPSLICLARLDLV